MKEKNADRVTILLATYNGAKYVGEQIDSILKQTYTNWHLIIRDDKSSDNTNIVLAEYQSNYPDKITVVKDNLNNLGGTLNFNALLQIANKEKYIMLCDQDDFWLPDKIESTLAEILKLEEQYGEDYPLLVHTNFHYVDSNLNIIESRKDFKATKIVDLNLCHLLAQNPIYGCTVMMNKKLAQVVGDIPATAENHDYWIAMAVSAFGKISYLDKKTILYRQHGNNVSGSYDDDSFSKRFKRIFIHKKNIKDAANKIGMAESFRAKYLNTLTVSQLNLIDNFIDFSKNKRLLLVFQNLKDGVRRQTSMQTFLFYVSAYFSKV